MKALAGIACALFFTCAWAGNQKAEPMYVRGGFNGWGTSHPLTASSAAIHEAVVDIPPGYHPFKLGSADWQTEWVIDPASSVDVRPGQAYRMAAKPGREDFLFVREASRYRFTLDTSTDGPTLRVERLGALHANEGDPHPPGSTKASLQFDTWDGKRESATFSATGDTLRTYVHSTTAPSREAGPKHVSYGESADLPRIRTGSLPFDALFALALAEMRQDSVHAISDGNYNGGAPVPCQCFETGEKWHYVWTRDLSYAAALGLATLDPQRVRNSLLFKLSGYRNGITKIPAAAGTADGLQIIQDTGSGGSWPVSTDRVAWAFGAEAALAALPATERKAFGRTALKALANTIENDRIAAYDARTGLYTGEQSFLDWREQSYASWIPGELASMASSKALSTNVAHYKALTLAASLAREHGDIRKQRRYAAWAAQLKRAINERLWLADAGMYSSLTAGHFDGASMHKFDWLGQALAIVTGVASDERAASILARYPHGPMGPPVIYPQQPGRPVYHNRAVWPFVTAYGLKAAALHGNASVADAAYASLMRGAALNLSNMENLEWLSGQALLLDERQPSLSGPVINSKRQLWSVGAYVGMVIENVFGINADAQGFTVTPFITSKLRRETFAGADAITLENLRLHGHRIRVRIALPRATGADGFYRVRAVRLNGRAVTGPIAWAHTGDESHVDVELDGLPSGEGKITRVNANPYEEDTGVYAPADPARPSVTRDASGAVHVLATTTPGTGMNIYRNGSLAAANVSGDWTDTKPVDGACYSVEAFYPLSGDRSHHSQPACTGEPIDIPVTDARTQATAPPQRIAGFAEAGIRDWGRPGERFTVQAIAVPATGRYAVQLRYHNAANQVNLGISNGVKWLTVKDEGGRVIGRGVVQMPHAPIGSSTSEPVYSTPLHVSLAAGQSYRLQLDDFYNMSYLQSNATFSGAGGATGASNRFDLFGIRLLRISESVNPGASSGRVSVVEGIHSPQLQNSRALRIYLPPGYDKARHKRYPVIYMHDGQNLFDARTAAYGAEWRIDETIDSLVATGQMEEVIVVGIDNTADRIAEYTPCCDSKYGGGRLDAYTRFITDTVKPYVDARYRTLPDREHTAIMGSSLGGLASVLIAQRRPDIFSMSASLSGSFWWDGRSATRNVAARLPVKFYLDAGTKDDGLDDTRLMRDALAARGYGEALLFHVAEGASHNEKSWAARVDRPLRWFFPRTPVSFLQPGSGTKGF